MYPPPDTSKFTDAPVEFLDEIAGVYIRSTVLAKAGDCITQHQHDHNHATLCGSGSARIWVDGNWHGDVKAGHAIEIKAGHQHLFQALDDNTLLSCLHDVASAMSIKVKGI